MATLVLVLESRKERGLLVEILEEKLMFIVILIIAFEIWIHDLAHELYGVLQHVLLIEVRRRRRVDELIGKVLKLNKQVGKRLRYCELILIYDEHVFVGGHEMREILLVHSYDERHEVFIGSVDEVEGQVVHQHVLPLQWLDQLQQAFNHHHVQVLALACYYDLLLEQDA